MTETMKRVVLEVTCIVPDYTRPGQIEGILEHYEFTVQQIVGRHGVVLQEDDGYVSMALWKSEREIPAEEEPIE